jgi:hypothetical protein
MNSGIDDKPVADGGVVRICHGMNNNFAESPKQDERLWRMLILNAYTLALHFGFSPHGHLNIFHV